jgi:hypothetical protein
MTFNIAATILILLPSLSLSAQQPAPKTPPAEQATAVKAAGVQPSTEPAPSEATATFTSGVSNVRVDVQVTNGKDLVKDLTQSDFTV